MKNKAIMMFTMVLFSASIMFCQTGRANNDSLKGHHSFGINMGIKANSKTEVQNDIVFVDMKSGFTGGIEYGYWFTNDFQFGININLVESSIDLNYGGVKNNAVIAMLCGFKYYPESLKLADAGRVYFGAYAGPVIGFATKEKGFPFVSERITETVIGGEIIAGIDIFVAKWLKMGPAVNYNFMADFSEITGYKKNFSGFGFVFNLGFVL